MERGGDFGKKKKQMGEKQIMIDHVHSSLMLNIEWVNNRPLPISNSNRQLDFQRSAMAEYKTCNGVAIKSSRVSI